MTSDINIQWKKVQVHALHNNNFCFSVAIVNKAF